MSFDSLRKAIISHRSNAMDVQSLLMNSFKCSLLLALSAPFLMAGERFEKVFPITKNPCVMITNYTGIVTVRGWQRQEVKVIAANFTRNVEIDTELIGGKVKIATHVLDKLATAEKARVDYQIFVPEDSNLDIQTNMGTLEVENIRGKIEIDAVEATVKVQGVSGYLQARSLGSKLTISNASGIVQTNTVSGDILFDHLQSNSVNANSTLGNISYDGEFISRGKYAFITNEGAILIHCAEQASVEWDAKTVKGVIESDLPITSKKHSSVSRDNGKQCLLGTLNRGEATVQLSTFSGKIKIIRK
jgi:DUF4097 and DUF4098 domain-containing protein YvlB